jgi:hypothetical protein
LTKKTNVTAVYIKPLTSAETGGAPYIRAKVAAKATGLGLSTIRRIGTRRFGNADYVRVRDINAFIVGEIPDEIAGAGERHVTVNPPDESVLPSSLTQAGNPPFSNFSQVVPPKDNKKNPKTVQPAELSRRHHTNAGATLKS